MSVSSFLFTLLAIVFGLSCTKPDAARAAASTTEDSLAPFIGKYALVQAINGRCYKRAQAGFGGVSPELFRVDFLLASEDGSTDLDVITDQTKFWELYFATFKVPAINGVPQISPVRDGLAGFRIGTRTETHWLTGTKLMYSQTAMCDTASVPCATIRTQVALEGDSLTLKKYESYPFAARGARHSNVECVYRQTK